MKTKCLVILITLSSLCFKPMLVSAQEKPEIIIEQFFYIFQNISCDSAINYVFSTNKWMDVNLSLVDDIKKNLKRVTSVLGPYYGYEVITKKYVGTCFVTMDYLLKYDKLPIKFSFILYKPNMKWQIHNVNFTDKFEKDFETAPNVKAALQEK